MERSSYALSPPTFQKRVVLYQYISTAELSDTIVFMQALARKRYCTPCFFLLATSLIIILVGCGYNSFINRL